MRAGIEWAAALAFCALLWAIAAAAIWYCGGIYP
jgi:hypothetical protein